MPVSSLDPASTALVLVDLQRGVVSRDVGPHPADTVVENSLLLAEAFQAAGAPVVLVRRESAAGPTQPVDAPESSGRVVLGDVVDELRPHGDVTVTTQTWSAFHGTPLDADLRARGVRTVVLAGMATNMAVESTARAAHDHGYGVVVVADATSSTEAVMHEFAVARVFPLFARVTTTSSAIAAVTGPGA